MRKRIKADNILSHKEVLGQVIRSMENKGFTRYEVSTGYLLLNEAIFFPDCIFHKTGEKFVDAIEVKPGYVRSGGIVQGIGQCLAYLALGFRPFLATTSNHLDYILLICQHVPQLGIICCYSNEVVIASSPVMIETPATTRILDAISNPGNNQDLAHWTKVRQALRKKQEIDSKPEPGSDAWKFLHEHKLVGKSVDTSDNV